MPPDDDALPASEPIEDPPLSEADFSPASEESGGDDAAPGQSPPQGRSPQQGRQEAAAPTIRDLVQNFGYQFGPQAPANDYDALVHLARRAQQADQLERERRQQDVYRDLGRQLAPKAAELQQFFRQGEQPPGPKAYEPPPFDKRWAQLVDRDEATGMYVAKPGVPPEIAERVNAYSEWSQRFIENPAEMFQAVLKDRESDLEERISRRVEAAIAQERQASEIQQIVRQNAGWFYQKDPSGQVAFGLDGQPQITAVGRQYLQNLNQLAQMGIANPVHRDHVARSMLGPSLQQASSSGDVESQAAARQARAVQNRSGADRNALQALGRLAREETPGATEPDQEGLSFAERMRAAMDAENITDRDFRQESAFYGG